MSKIILYLTTANVLLLGFSEFSLSQADKNTINFPVLHYQSAISLGLDSFYICSKIDSIVERGIKEHAFPGCQILAAKDGAIFFDKVYGYHTYDSIDLVKKTDLYDWASVTKITGTLPAIMKLYDEGKLNLDTPFCVYWKPFKHSNKKNITLREILSHQAGLIPWIPYWRIALNRKAKMKRSIIRSDSSERFCLKVADSIYLNKNFTRRVYKKIKRSQVYRNKKYKYSGLAFFIFPKIIENITGEKYEEYIKSRFFRPLGANTVTYNPTLFFDKSRIMPTELDSYFRHQLIHGYVHDEGAAMMGGVSGNAGLFGTAIDLAKIMQMYLNGGAYGDKRFISNSVLKHFACCQFPENENRRGLGFDKPLLKDKEEGYTAIDASDKSFGHSGYTGTFTWADPETGILLVILSNRVYPTRDNVELFNLDIRKSIHQVIYDALKMGIKTKSNL